jgi:catechol 2,3-dioxygenase-like lactoylglutathione lyase family enzyme
MEVEHVDFVSVPVTDMKRSIDWYTNTLGLPQVGHGGFPEFKLGDNAFLYLLDMEAIGSAFTAPHSASIALRVADVAEARTELEGKGVVFEGEIFDTSVCHMAPFKDPDGNTFMLHRRYAPVEQ